MSDNYYFDLLTGPTSAAAAPPPQSRPPLPPSPLPPSFGPHFEFSSSEEEEEEEEGDGGGDGAETGRTISSTTKHLDCMLQFLDRKLSTAASSPPSDGPSGEQDPRGWATLPEFVGRGGGASVFKLPVRAAVHSGQPPCMEVRLHPLREAQIGCALETLVATPSQLWACGKRGVRVWDLGANIYAMAVARGEGVGTGANAEPGIMPYRESAGGMSPTLCLVADEASQLVWSGHRDGRIRCWSMSFGGKILNLTIKFN